MKLVVRKSDLANSVLPKLKYPSRNEKPRIFENRVAGGGFLPDAQRFTHLTRRRTLDFASAGARVLNPNVNIFFFFFKLSMITKSHANCDSSQGSKVDSASFSA